LKLNGHAGKEKPADTCGEIVKVSIVLCTYKLERLKDVEDALKGIERQTHEDIETIVVVDGNRKLYDRIKPRISSLFRGNHKIVLNEGNMGLSFSKNVGIKHASGEIVAFLDDDAIPEENWVKSLVSSYQNHPDVAGVGGKIVPLWVLDNHIYLPRKLYWIIGATYEGFTETEKLSKVRNTFGGNTSFRREIFDKVGLFNENLGRKKTAQMQGEETEFCMRILAKTGKTFVYNPKAIVRHKVFPERTELKFIINRAFWQGFSKAFLFSVYKFKALSTELMYLKKLILGGSSNEPKSRSFKLFKSLRENFLVTVVVIATGCGFLYYAIHNNIKSLITTQK